MELWIAVVLCGATTTGCIICAVATHQKKSKKIRVLAITLGLVALVMFLYSLLALILVFGIK